MMGRRVRYRDGRVEKRYHRDALLVERGALGTRMAAIEALSAQHPTVPTTTFRWEDDTLVLEQERIRAQPLPEQGGPVIQEALQGLADLLEVVSPEVVHGDVVRKNLVFDGHCLHLVDWEPALRQIRDGRPTLLYTEPYLSLHDREADRLSTETDKLGFFFAAYRLVHRRNPLTRVRDLVTARRRERRDITPIPETEFMTRSFSGLLDLARGAGDWTCTT